MSLRDRLTRRSNGGVTPLVPQNESPDDVSQPGTAGTTDARSADAVGYAVVRAFTDAVSKSSRSARSTRSRSTCTESSSSASISRHSSRSPTRDCSTRRFALS